MDEIGTHRSTVPDPLLSATMLLSLAMATSRAPTLAPSRLVQPCMMARTEEERKEQLAALFGNKFNDVTAKELMRVTKVEQPKAPEEAPEWMKPQTEGAQRLTLWLEDGGVNLDNFVLIEDVQAATTDSAVRMAVVTTSDVAAGSTIFEVPASLLITADAAFTDPDVGRELRNLAARQPGGGFETFAIAAMLAAERVRRGAVKGRLRRTDGGAQVGLINFARDGSRGELLPQWQVEEQGALQANYKFSPMIQSLPWVAADECLVETPEKAQAVESGAKLIAKMIEPAARNAWMKATQRKGAVQSTSDEDVDCRAIEALYMAMSTQLDPPPPLGRPRGRRQWGDGSRPDGPAICPLANFVLPPSDADRDAARAAGAFNALLGRPTTGNVDVALRCVAAYDLPAGTVVIADVPGSGGGGVSLRPRERVRVVSGPSAGKVGMILTLRPKDKMPLVRLDGDDKQLVAVPAEQLAPEDESAAAAAEEEEGPRKRTAVM